VVTPTLVRCNLHTMSCAKYDGWVRVSPATPPSLLPVAPGADPDLLEAFLAATRAMVAVAARSLADLDEDITLPQFRCLVTLGARGPQRPADLAAGLKVDPSTASRMTDRLVRKRLVRRARTKEDRRMVRLHLTGAGRATVDRVTDQRRAELERLLEQMPARGRKTLTAGLRRFAAAAGELAEPDWALGWDK
jgi:DNA-binding MarR family transcriptional regulator